VPACAIGAGLVEQSLPDIFPDSVRPIVFDRVRFLDFDGAETAQALDAQHMARNFREATVLDRQPWFSCAHGSASTASHNSSGKASLGAGSGFSLSG
jgi:hypothetical protein